MNHPQLEPRLTANPERPRAFGEDGGHFYRYYDAIADELDEDMVKSLKAQLDGILLFAGLFAGINSAFLAMTLPEMRADPADDTNALLLQLVIGGNSSINSVEDLPSAKYNPPLDIITINILFSLSLALAVISSFFAILGNQWIVYYRRRSGGGVEHQRWEQLRRYFGVKHWRLEVILGDIIPILLQLALIIFSFGFLFYLRRWSFPIDVPSGLFIQVVSAIVVQSIFMASWDQWCPFQNPISRLLRLIDQIFREHSGILTLIIPLAGILYMCQTSLWGGILTVCLFPLCIGRTLVHYRQGCAPWNTWLNQWIHDGSQQPWALSWRKDIRWMVFDTFKRLVADLVPSGEEIAYLQAAAIKRVLCTSEDFNSLVYTAVNIQAMTEKQVARFILDDDTALRRLEELTKSSDRALATAFSHALAHLLWGGQSAELFVEQRHRHLYSTKTPFPEIRKYSQEPHPLKQMIGSVCGGLNACIKSPGPNPDDLLELQFYFELLQLIIDEQSDIQAFSKWLDRVIRRQPPQQISTPLVICLVADTVHILKTGINSAAASSRLQISPSNIGPVQEVQESGRLEQEREGFFAVQQQRVEAVKRLVGRLGWEMLSAPSSSQPSPGTSVFEIIQEAFSTCSSPSRRHPNEIDVWLLEQALLLSTQNCHGHGLQLVAKSALGLLVSFDEPEDSMPDSTSSQDNQKENRARCAKVLSHSIQVMRDYAGPEEFIQRISPALDKLVDLWARFKDDFNKNPDLNDDTMLSSWLKIRVALDKPEEYGWGPLHQQQFGDAYPSLKLGFDGMALVLQGVETLSDVDQNPAELPRAADFDKQAGQTEPDAVDNGAVQRSDEYVHNPLVYSGEGQKYEDTGEPDQK